MATTPALPERSMSVGSINMPQNIGKRTTHLIPTPGAMQPRPKRVEPLEVTWWVIGPVALLMIGLGVALEVALSISKKNNGFSVPQKNVFSFASTNFLTSFFPILFVVPLRMLWTSSDAMIKRYQPYISLSRGNVSANDSILIDYISENYVLGLFSSLKRKHWIVLISALLSLVTLTMQPLAGAILSVQQLPEPQDTSAISIKSIGLTPDVLQLNGFLAAAGFVDAATINNLTDPPFIQGGWATADFQCPGSWLNGSVTVGTTGIQTNANCSNPQSLSLANTSTGNLNISATTTSGCAVSVPINQTNGNQQYGVLGVPNCGPAASSNATFKPVFFWFYVQTNSTPQVAGVVCQPTIAIFNVSATADPSSFTLSNVTGHQQLDSQAFPNNVTGPPLSGLAYNGVVFDPSSNPFVQARATSIGGIVPGAIFQTAIQGNGLQSTLDDPNGFLNITNQVYTKHLSIAAKSIYFQSANNLIPAVMTSLKPRLIIDSLAAHLLSVILILVGFIGLLVQISHMRARRYVNLHSYPGSIASAVSLTAHSGFGQLLYPYDDEASIRKKLEGMRFRLDDRTGAIVAQDGEGDDVNMTMSLLGNEEHLSSAGYDIEHFKDLHELSP